MMLARCDCPLANDAERLIPSGEAAVGSALRAECLILTKILCISAIVASC